MIFKEEIGWTRNTAPIPTWSPERYRVTEKVRPLLFFDPPTFYSFQLFKSGIILKPSSILILIFFYSPNPMQPLSPSSHSHSLCPWDVDDLPQPSTPTARLRQLLKISENKPPQISDKQEMFQFQSFSETKRLHKQTDISLRKRSKTHTHNTLNSGFPSRKSTFQALKEDKKPTRQDVALTKKELLQLYGFKIFTLNSEQPTYPRKQQLPFFLSQPKPPLKTVGKKSAQSRSESVSHTDTLRRIERDQNELNKSKGRKYRSQSGNTLIGIIRQGDQSKYLKRSWKNRIRIHKGFQS